jgi:anthranilate/para-aminobenzoate synthase component II
MIVIIDNYDSFVYNLAQYVGELGWEPDVHRNDRISLSKKSRNCGLLTSSFHPTLYFEAGIK